MGRRKKSTKKIQTKKKQVVATVFKCPFCSHDDAVECKMCVLPLALLLSLVARGSVDETDVGVLVVHDRRDRERNIGHLSCRVCTESFQTPIHYLSAPIDVYTDWIDECDALNR
ncbi:hypothetical protein P43SY_008065 [Pythium insidiosum]|uniref:Transcription elongation factor 1 homolog n=1 Tax=Pythium insidiosum TaxID=114742 RepID=A0AAD5M4X3_PYTIN|nr:hypothetical protein P43SY_008065 [Pythium insidiosum]KAJ0404697.1 hypothetical protein ATCC90586_001247 [Pythium insidiosum]